MIQIKREILPNFMKIHSVSHHAKFKEFNSKCNSLCVLLQSIEFYHLLKVMCTHRVYFGFPYSKRVSSHNSNRQTIDLNFLPNNHFQFNIVFT